jgi:hypothetical protein
MLTSNKKKESIGEINFHSAISYLFHPIIFPLLASLLYLFTSPRFVSRKTKLIILLVVFISTYIFPIVLLSFLKGLKMIKSFHLTDIEERKFPTLFFSFLAILTGRLLIQLQIVDDLALFFIAGGFSFLVIYGFLWIRIKVSIHTLGIGGFIGFLLQLSHYYHQNYLISLAFLFILFGVVASARLTLKAHSISEIFWGLGIGIFTQLLLPFIYQNI